MWQYINGAMFMRYVYVYVCCNVYVYQYMAYEDECLDVYVGIYMYGVMFIVYVC